MKKILLFVCVGVFVLSCTKYNDYKKYISAGEDTYPGKPDSLVAYAGHNRVLLSFILSPDPSIIGARVYWSNKADSLTLSIKAGSAAADTIRTYISGLAEGTVNFQVQTFDAAGNMSVPSLYTCNVYGDNYAATLLNIGTQSVAPIPPDMAMVVFGPLDFEDGLVGVRVSYTDDSGAAVDTVAALTQAAPFVMFPGATDGTVLTYSALYLPEPTAIDTFAVAPTSVVVP